MPHSMQHPGFECIQATSLLSKEGLPNVAHLSLLPSPIENSLDVAVACFDGRLLLAHFDDSPAVPHRLETTTTADIQSSMDVDAPASASHGSKQTDVASVKLVDTITIGQDNYPVLSTSSVSRDEYTIIAFAGLGREVHLKIRSSTTFPSFEPLITLHSGSPVSALYIQTLSFAKREEITWNVRVFYATQDKRIHLSSVSLAIASSGQIKAQEFHKLSFVGHNAQVRSLSFHHSSTGEPLSLLSAGDDFSLRVWPLNLLEGDKITKCTTYEGHEDDVLAVDCKSGWVITGSKDKTVGFWDLNPAKTARAEKTRQVAINRVSVGSVVRSVLLSDDATVAFVGCGDGTLKIVKRTEAPTSSAWLWNVTDSHQLHNAPVESLIFTQSVLVSGSRDEHSSVAVWKIPENV